MKLTHVIMGILGVILLSMAGILAILLFSTPSQSELASNSSVLSVSAFGTAGGSGYVSFTYNGKGNITLVSYESEPSKKVYVIDDPEAIDSTRISDLMNELKPLENFGYTITLTNETRINDGINIIPAGAMPAYALFSLKEPSNGTISDRIVVLMGSKDLLIGNGIKKYPWYNELTPTERKRLLIYNGTLDEYMGRPDSQRTLSNDILLMRWSADYNKTYQINGNGSRTFSIPLTNASHLRLLYDLGPAKGAEDSQALLLNGGSLLSSSPQAVFPWEKSTLQFSLTPTNGTAYFSVMKDGKVVRLETLRRVTDENVFIEMLQFQDPGDYVLNVSDNSGVIASGILHVKDLSVSLSDHTGVSYTFLMAVDGAPLDNSGAFVSIGNSSQKKKFFISQGLMTVGAKLDKGPNTFNIQFKGNDIPFTFNNDSESVFSFYITYGIPALALVLLIYVGARMTKRPIYALRFGDSSTYVREEMRLSPKQAVEAITLARKDLGIGKVPVTQQEFSMSLKRHFTKGADVTEGNLEGLLKKLQDRGNVEHHHEFYQIKGDGDVKTNALRRMIKEKLIENGVAFRESGNRFVTKDNEIGLFGEKFTRKGIIVVDDEAEIERIKSRMDASELAKLKIKQANGMLSFIPIDRLSDVI